MKILAIIRQIKINKQEVANKSYKKHLTHIMCSEEKGFKMADQLSKCYIK